MITFIKMIEERGIKHIMARPGPYINAEWGFLGFGAIPEWFHKKFPDSHMKDARGFYTRVYDYHSPELHEYTQKWFAEVYKQVLQKNIGPGKPISFLQIDNETNYMWSPLYAGDYNTRSLNRYRSFLQEKYGSLETLNLAQGTSFPTWEAVDAPRTPKLNRAQDRDWYAFEDESIHSYLKLLRTYWENLGVREPQVLFTLAESYNAPLDGLLPNYRFRNDPGSTGMMTVNLYPKTFDTDAKPLLNLPFKTDHDVKNADAASDYYLGSKQEWVLGPEIQGGWWRGIDISPEARQQTYLSVLGHGLKALFVYYFNEGFNWDAHWQKESIRPYFNALRSDPRFRDLDEGNLPAEFWDELQKTVDAKIGSIYAYYTWHQTSAEVENLYFDAPLDANAQPRQHYFDLKNIADKVIAPYQDFLGKAVAVEDRVCIVRDNIQHLPSPNLQIDSSIANGEWSGGLLGYLLQAGVNPHILHWGLNPAVELTQCDLIFWQDSGLVDPTMVNAIQVRLSQGATVVSFLENSLAEGLGVRVRQEATNPRGDNWVRFSQGALRAYPNLLNRYDLGADARCSSIAKDELGADISYHCNWSGGGNFLQVGMLPYDLYNSNDYAVIKDSRARLEFLRGILKIAQINPKLEMPADNDRTVAFARTVDHSSFYITSKTGSPLGANYALKLHGLPENSEFEVKDLLADSSELISGEALSQVGMPVKLGPNGSTVLFVAPAPKK